MSPKHCATELLLDEVVKFNPVMTKVMPVQTFIAVGCVIKFKSIVHFPHRNVVCIKAVSWLCFVSLSLYLNGAMLLMFSYLTMFIRVYTSLRLGPYSLNTLNGFIHVVFRQVL